jgi:hypothetical protein
MVVNKVTKGILQSDTLVPVQLIEFAAYRASMTNVRPSFSFAVNGLSRYVYYHQDEKDIH